MYEKAMGYAGSQDPEQRWQGGSELHHVVMLAAAFRSVGCFELRMDYYEYYGWYENVFEFCSLGEMPNLASESVWA